jgi:SAM-dependent methyltransferase
VHDERETARYYDQEVGREDRSLDPRRIEARARFVDAARSPVLEIGTGPGRDAIALVDAGLDVVGVDLSVGHATRSAARGLSVAVATARALPFATGSFRALWSMSTLMHIPADGIEPALHEIRRVVAPGGTIAIGVWGGPDVEHYGNHSTGGPRRLFARRSEPRWRSLLSTVGRIDTFDVWAAPAGAPTDFHYHLAFLTAPAGDGPRGR